MQDSIIYTVGLVLSLVYLLGLMASVDALLRSKNSQSAIAWSLSLIMFPILMLPIYLIFSGRHFIGYVNARQQGEDEINKMAVRISDNLLPKVKAHFELFPTYFEVLEKLAKMPFARYNRARLLIDGQVTFDAIASHIEQAQQYILFQFFIVKDDHLGSQLKELLINKARQGVRVYFIYDSIGSHSLPKRYSNELTEAGIQVVAFCGTKGKKARRFQINFRNHRKIVVIDGHSAFVGGHNVGDEYLGKHPKLSPWRDTHVLVQGPAVLGVQLTFLEDWNWMEGNVPELNWEPVIDEVEDQRVLVVPSGPSDSLSTCALLFTQLIHTAQKRVWIVSPYFVPDDTVISALQLAVMRGVDVRIMLPENPDHLLVYLASFSYLAETVLHGIRVFKYQKGFLHQKVILVDEALAGIGTANFDNRSFHLNFELTLLFADDPVVKNVEEMLLTDFGHCRELSMEDIEKRPIIFKLAVRVARLLSPLL